MDVWVVVDILTIGFSSVLMLIALGIIIKVGYEMIFVEVIETVGGWFDDLIVIRKRHSKYERTLKNIDRLERELGIGEHLRSDTHQLTSISRIGEDGPEYIIPVWRKEKWAEQAGQKRHPDDPNLGLIWKIRK
jgi:hypothetical protein